MGAFFAACGDGRFETGISSTIKRILPKSLVALRDRKSTRLNSSHGYISYAVFCLKKKKNYHVISLFSRSERESSTIIFAQLCTADQWTSVWAHTLCVLMFSVLCASCSSQSYSSSP